MTATLEFRGLDLLADGRRIQIVRGFLGLPAMRGADFVVSARTGRISGNRVADVNIIELAGYIAAATPEEWRAATDAFLSVLDESGAAPGLLVARSPYLGLALGEATINARVKNIMPGDIVAKLFQRWSVELESVDPYWLLTGS